MLKQLEQLGTVEEVAQYRCKAISLTDSHPTLSIRVHHNKIPGLRWTLNFVAVDYIQCPIFWTGANFVEAPTEIIYDLWKRVYSEGWRGNMDFSDNVFEMQMAKLFSVCMLETTTQPILIAYGSVHISDREDIYPK